MEEGSIQNYVFIIKETIASTSACNCLFGYMCTIPLGKPLCIGKTGLFGIMSIVQESWQNQRKLKHRHSDACY